MITAVVAFLKKRIIAYLAVLTLIVAAPIISHAQGAELAINNITLAINSNLNNMVFFTNTNFQIQDVFYKYEYFYVFINLTDVFPGQPVYLDITISGPVGGTLYQGEVYGGYLYYGELEIVPPIYNGATYTLTATACLIVNYTITNDCVSGSGSYIEEDHPPAKIVGIPYIVNANGESTSVLIGGNSYTLVVNVNDTGYIPYTYYVKVDDSAGLISTQVVKVSTQALSNVTVDIPINVAAPNTVVTDVITISVYGDGYLDSSYSMQVLITPSRPGPFKLISVNTTTLYEGQEDVIEAILQNTGYTADDVSASAYSTISSDTYATVSSSTVSEGNYLYVYIYVTPNTAGSGVIKLSVTYTWPYTTNTYTDTFQFNVNVLANVAVNFASTNGGQVSTVATINGQQTNNLWVMPGTYTISVPSIVTVSNGVRYVFSHWSNGYGSSPTISVNVENSMELTAYYTEQYYVSIVDQVTGKSIIGWFNGGSTLTLPTLPQYVSTGNGSRLVFQEWSCGYPVSATITVNSPINCTAEWIKQYNVIIVKEVIGPSGPQSEVINATWINAGSTFTLPQVSQFIYIGNGSRLMFKQWICNGNTQQSSLMTVNQPLTCTEVWITQYRVILENKFIQLFGPPIITVLNEAWINASGRYSVYAYDYKPTSGNVLLPIVYKYALVITSSGSYRVDSPTVNVESISSPVTIILIWVYSLIEIIGTSSGGAMVLGIVFRDRIKYATTLIVKRATTVIMRKGTNVKTTETAEDGTKVYAGKEETNTGTKVYTSGELPVKPLEEGTKVKSSDETVVKEKKENKGNETGGAS